MADTMVTNETPSIGLLAEVVKNATRLGVPLDFWKALAEGDDALRRAEAAVLGSSTFVTATEAAQIMGTNFHGVNDVEQHFGVTFTDRQRKLLETIPIAAEVLRACAGTHILVAGFPMTITDVHVRYGQHFYSKNDPLYGDTSQRFSTATKLTFGWHLVRKDEAPKSTSKSWNQQEKAVTDPDFIPPTVTVVYAAILHYAVTGERLYRDVWVRTSSMAASGYHVYVRFYPDGLLVRYWYDYPGSCVGVASARKLS